MNSSDKELIKTSPESREGSKSAAWWERAGALTLVTAIIAAVAPITTGVSGYFELQVSQEKNRFEMRDKYLERVIDKDLGAEERERLFEFLVAVFEDDPLKDWAQEQLFDATEELKQEVARVQLENESLKTDMASLLSKQAFYVAKLNSLNDEVQAAKSFKSNHCCPVNLSH